MGACGSTSVVDEPRASDAAPKPAPVLAFAANDDSSDEETSQRKPPVVHDWETTRTQRSKRGDPASSNAEPAQQPGPSQVSVSS